MAEVHLRKITLDNYLECLSLSIDDSQSEFVATNAKSLAEAKVNLSLVPLAIYDVAARGWEQPEVPIVGFTMYEITAGVGFILRLMIDRNHQRKGYGRAAVIEVIRRLKLYPEVEIVATSHKRNNQAASNLYRSLGFIEWDIGWARQNEAEVFLRLWE